MKLSVGPGALVAAAFIGPGTVTACSLAGANFGLSLVWALVFATLATMVVQYMAARLGVIGRVGLGEALMAGAGSPLVKGLTATLVLLALALGNAAYEAGNLTGGALGVGALVDLDTAGSKLVVIALALVAAVAFGFARYKTLETVLVGLVVIMSLAFAGSALLTKVDFAALASGLVPRIPENGLLTAVALIGTTIVPYNLFLHAAAARERWPEATPGALREARNDTLVSIGLGGLISIFILATAASVTNPSDLPISSAADMARGLEPVFGSLSRYLVGVGLLAAGLTSAITAPLATAYAVTEIMKKPREGRLFRGGALVVLLIGTTVALLGIRPVALIQVAQVANGLLLPIIAIFLLIAMNRRNILGDQTNGPLANAIGGVIVLVTVGLGLRLVLRAIGVWP